MAEPEEPEPVETEPPSDAGEHVTREERFPPMPLASWTSTKETLHRFLQIVGKIRLSAAPRRNHWWHVPFHLTGRGLTTRPMGEEPFFAIDLDLVDHMLVIATSDGRTESLPLAGNSVASFYEATLTALRELDVSPVIERPRPFDLADGVPFADDREPRPYDPVWANRYWRVLGAVDLLLEEFAGRFSGKTSPVHHFWHTMDIAVTRFSDREVGHPPPVDSVTREAYSRETISAGFWFGDPTFPEPAFYSYTTPEPAGLASRPLHPEAAKWVSRGDAHLAILRYDEVRTSAEPAHRILEFFESAYLAGARLAGWDVERLAAPNGVTAIPAASSPGD